MTHQTPFRRRVCLLIVAIALSAVSAVLVIAQSDAKLAALEARLMTRLEQRLAEETEDIRRDQEAMRLSLQQAIQDLAASKNSLDRKVLDALDAGKTAPAVTVLVERAELRDEAVRKAPQRNDTESQARADEWKKIGALAFLDDTAGAVAAYERALSFAPNDPQALDQLAWLYDRLGRDTDRDRVAERLASASEPESRVRGLLHRADVHLEANDGTTARPYVTQALEAARAANSKRLEVKATTYLAGADALSGEFDAARTAAEQALAMARSEKLPQEEAEALYAQGSIEFMEASRSPFRRKGRLERADQAFAEAERVLVGVKDEIGAAHIQVRRGHLARVLNNREEAEQQLRAAIAVFERRGVRSRLGFAQQQLGTVLAMDGKMDEARVFFQKGVEVAHATGRVAYEALALGEWAVAEAKAGKRNDGCRLARQSEALYERVPARQNERRRVGEMARQLCR
jgi:tetratricopeptide (TPR) repeat protein